MKTLVLIIAFVLSFATFANATDNRTWKQRTWVPQEIDPNLLNRLDEINAEPDTATKQYEAVNTFIFKENFGFQNGLLSNAAIQTKDNKRYLTIGWNWLFVQSKIKRKRIKINKKTAKNFLKGNFCMNRLNAPAAFESGFAGVYLALTMTELNSPDFNDVKKKKLFDTFDMVEMCK